MVTPCLRLRLYGWDHRSDGPNPINAAAPPDLETEKLIPSWYPHSRWIAYQKEEGEGKDEQRRQKNHRSLEHEDHPLLVNHQLLEPC